MLLSRIVLATTVLSAALAAQQNLLLPDNHHLSETVAKTTGGTWWGSTTTGRRFQVLYEASHFTNAATAVNGPIVINSLGFRGEDGESNIGGQTFSNITVDVYKTVSTATTMHFTTFATNTAAAVLLGSTVIPTVVCTPSTGACPNNENITLPLGVLAAFDPTGGSGPEVNLLIDIKYTGYTAVTVPVLNQNLLTNDTTGGLAVVRGRGITGTTSVVLTGTTSLAPPTIRVGFAGPGGNATLIPARVETIGAACGGSPATFYQLFRHTQQMDLGGKSLTLTPDNNIAPNFYTVTAGTAPIDPAGFPGAPSSVADDASFGFALAGTFNFPGGSTTSVRPCTNGYIVIEPGSTVTGGDYSCQLDDFLGVINNPTNGNVARLAPMWYDFHCGRNTTTHTNSGLHAVNVGTVGLITWRNVGNFDVATAGNTLHTMQCAIDTATGIVEFRYDANMDISADTLDDGLVGGDFVMSMIGFTRGRIGGTTPSVDPQSRDLSFETPFSTSVEGATGNAGISASDSVAGVPPHYAGRMYAGRSITWNATNIPAGTILATLNLDIAATQPGFQFPGITAPGCMISTSLSPLFIGHETLIAPGPSFTGTLPIAVPPVIWYGAEITAQWTGIDIFGGPNLIPWSSNTLKHTVGLQ